jgi:F420-non-reducing hydrogenase iron-sulfur subunit
MTNNASVRPSLEWMAAEFTPRNKTKVTLFHCVNALDGIALPENDNCEIQSVQLPCSSLTREVVLLKAFEAGADAVAVLVCPQGSCRYLEGNFRAARRVSRVKKLLDEIGLDGRRLNIYNIPRGDQSAVNQILDRTQIDLNELGPSPAA